MSELLEIKEMTPEEIHNAKIDIAQFCASQGFQLMIRSWFKEYQESEDYRRFPCPASENSTEQFHKGRIYVLEKMCSPGLGVMPEWESERLAKANLK